jgi:hypothetical protein
MDNMKMCYFRNLLNLNAEISHLRAVGFFLTRILAAFYILNPFEGDQIVDLAEKNFQLMRGHNCVWHSEVALSGFLFMILGLIVYE